MKKNFVIFFIAAVAIATSYFQYPSIENKVVDGQQQPNLLLEIPTISSDDFFTGDIEQVRNSQSSGSSTTSLQGTLFFSNSNHLTYNFSSIQLNTKSLNAFLYLEKFLSHIYPFHAFW